MLSGDNGILTKANEAKTKDKIESDKTIITMEVANLLTEYYAQTKADQSPTGTPVGNNQSVASYIAHELKNEGASTNDLTGIMIQNDDYSWTFSLRIDNTIKGTIAPNGSLSWNK